MARVKQCRVSAPNSRKLVRSSTRLTVGLTGLADGSALKVRGSSRNSPHSSGGTRFNREADGTAWEHTIGCGSWQVWVVHLVFTSRDRATIQALREGGTVTALSCGAAPESSPR